MSKTFDTPENIELSNHQTDNLEMQNPSTAPRSPTPTTPNQMLPIEQSKLTKPLSAYGLFFRDTVTAIKNQNPTSSFQELSKIVASMWDILDPVHKEIYQQKTELAKREYWKQVNAVGQQREHLKPNDSATLQIDGCAEQQPRAQQLEKTPANDTVTKTTTQTEESDGQSAQQEDLPTADNSLQKCIRKNCTKPAIKSPDWEDEYCSNECVVIHCRDVFNEWVRSNLDASE